MTPSNPYDDSRKPKVVSASVARQILQTYRPQLPAIATIGVFSCVSALLEVSALSLLVLLAKLTTDGKTVWRGRLSWFDGELELAASTLIAVGVGAVVGRLFAELLSGWLSAKLVTDYATHSRNRLLALFLDASWARKSAVHAADLQQMLTLNLERSTLVLTNLAQMVGLLANVAVLIGSAFLLNPVYAGAISAIAATVTLVVRPLNRWVRRMAKTDWALQYEYGRQVNETVMLAREIEIFDVAEQVKTRIGAVVEQSRRLTRTSMFAQRVVTPAYFTVIFSIVFAALGTVVATGLAHAEVLGITALLLLRVSTYTQGLQTLYQSLAIRVIYLEDLAKFADEHRAAELPRRERQAPAIESIGGSSVVFGYKPELHVLRDLDFSVKRGEMVGVLGRSGAGKTTLIKLLLGLHHPSEGAILVNGDPLTDVDPRSWYRRVAYVPQDAVLSTGTLADNIRFFRDWLTEKQVLDAARAACLDDVIALLPKGLDTDLGVAGKELSGGQRQRIAIARALVGAPDVLILDEPTSALDPLSEDAIRRTLESLHGKLTTFIIAHRMSLIGGCDRLLVLESGKLVGFDTPQNLARNNPYYQQSLRLAQAEATLIDTQARLASIATRPAER